MSFTTCLSESAKAAMRPSSPFTASMKLARLRVTAVPTLAKLVAMPPVADLACSENATTPSPPSWSRATTALRNWSVVTVPSFRATRRSFAPLPAPRHASATWSR